MTTDLDALLEDVAAAQARIDAGTANMGEYDALSDAAPILAAEVQRLRDGGCARDQRTTQYCAEAVERTSEIARLRAETATLAAEAREARAALTALTDHDLITVEIAARQIVQRRERERRAVEEEAWRQKRRADGYPECDAQGCDNLRLERKGSLCLACIREARRLQMTEQAYMERRAAP